MLIRPPATGRRYWSGVARGRPAGGAAIESGTRLPTKQELALLARGLELTAGRLATILRPVVEHTAGGIRMVG